VRTLYQVAANKYILNSVLYFTHPGNVENELVSLKCQVTLDSFINKCLFDIFLQTILLSQQFLARICEKYCTFKHRITGTIYTKLYYVPCNAQMCS